VFLEDWPKHEPGVEDRAFYGLIGVCLILAPPYLICVLFGVFQLLLLYIKRCRLKKEIAQLHPDIARIYAKECEISLLLYSLKKTQERYKQVVVIVIGLGSLAIGLLVYFGFRKFSPGFSSVEPRGLYLFFNITLPLALIAVYEFVISAVIRRSLIKRFRSVEKPPIIS